MAQTSGGIPAVPSVKGIKECIRRCEHLFSREDIEQPADQGEWIQVSKQIARKMVRRRGGAVKGMSFSENKAFVQGIYVIAMGLRCAYLVDTITVDIDHAEAFSQCFSSMEAYRDVTFLLEERAEQVYIVNRQLMKARFRGAQDQRAASTWERDETLWLQVDWNRPITPVGMSHTLKAGIDRLMTKDWTAPFLDASDISSDLSRIASIRTIREPRDLPALSAWLLEYPVGYTFSDDSAAAQRNDGKQVQGRAQTVPSSGVHKTNLDGEPLILVKVKVSGDKELGDNYHLVAFSYPSKLLDESAATGRRTNPADSDSGETVREFLQRIPVALQERYESRLGLYHCRERPTIEVTTERIRLEKVVL